MKVVSAVGTLRADGHVAFPPGSRYLMVPRRPARAARAALALYEPVERRQLLACRAGEVITRAGLARLLPRNDREEVEWPWWEAFVPAVVEPLVGAVASVAFRVPGNPRVSLLAMDAAGRPIAFAKLLNAPQPHVAAAASALLSRAPTRSFGIPLALDEGEFSGRLYRVLRPLPEGPHRPPPLDPARLADVVDEFHERLSELERPPGTPAGHVACHADLTPRNLRVASDGGWWLFDWDNVRFGPRLADELRYWCAWHAYRPKPSVERDSAAVLSLLRRRGSDSEIAEAVAWPEQVRQTYREIEPRLHAAVGAAVGAAP